MDNPATEVLEQELIDLLGLKNDPGMTYEDYFDELKEAAIAAQMNQSTYTSDQAELIREELIRVREKFKKDPKVKSTNFKFKSKTQKVNEDKKINKDNVSSINFPKLTGKVSNVKIKKTNLLPQSPQEEVKEEKKYKKEKVDKPKKSNELIKILNNINKKLNSILSTLSSQAALDTRNAERQRRDRESERRSRQESSLEGLGSGIRSIAKVGKTMLAPLENIWDKIVRFFTFVLLGKAFFAFMKWMSDPENKKKFDTIVKFLSKHWLLIAGAYILFGTSLGGLVRFILKSVIRLSAAMLKVIPRLLSVIAKSRMGRLGLAATALFTAGAIIPKLFPKTVDEQERNISEKGGTTQEKIQQLQNQKDKLNFFEKLQGKGSEIDEQIHKLQSGETKSYGFYNGGIIPSFADGGLLNLRSGIPVTGAKGDDTLIAAKTGEAVLTKDDQKDIYQKYGLNIPQYLSNRKPSVINSKNIKPKVGGGYFNGGIVQGFSNGGVVNKPTSLLDLGRQISDNPDHKFDPTLEKSIPLLYQILQSGRFKEKGWGNKAFMDQLTARLLVESSNFSRSKEMYNSDPRDPAGKGGYYYFGTNYGNRSDLGNRGFDDGYNFRGRGAIQLTGRNHYERFNKWLTSNGYKGIDVTKNPDLLATDPKVQALSTLYYLEDREKTFGIDFADIAKQGDSRSFTYNINGGYNHLAETQDNLRRIQGLPGGVNYGKGFLPRQPRTPGRTPQPGLNPFSMVGSTIRNLLLPGSSIPASAAAKPGSKPTAKPSTKSARWAIDPRGWFGKKDGGIIGGIKSGLSSIGTGLLNLISSPAKAASAKPTFKTRPRIAPSFTNSRKPPSTTSRRKLDEMRMGSIIKIAPIDTMPDRSMTGFRDLAESQYENELRNKFSSNSGVRGLKGGGFIKPGLDKVQKIQDNQYTSDMDRIDKLIRSNLPNTMAEYNESIENGFRPPTAPLTSEQIEKAIQNRKMTMMHTLLQSRNKKKSGGSISTPNKMFGYQKQMNDIRGMRANSLERQGRSSEAFGMRGFGMNLNINSLFHNGFVSENSGLNFLGGTADRQATLLQPGEYVLPKATVQTYSKAFFDNIVASTDPNSEPAKMGIKGKDISSGIKPYEIGNAGKPEFIKLPPINSGTNNSQSPPQMGTSKEVFFSPICEVDHAQSERQRILDVLGVITN